jgi:hypothetical protein
MMPETMENATSSQMYTRGAKTMRFNPMKARVYFFGKITLPSTRLKMTNFKTTRPTQMGIRLKNHKSPICLSDASPSGMPRMTKQENTPTDSIKSENNRNIKAFIWSATRYD